ncbi:MAG: zf-HC2 domain-containing protein [Myxococcota bacterium]
MECKSASELISQGIDGSLSADQSAQLEAHLQRCSTCRELAAALRVNASALASVGPTQAPPHLAARAFARAISAPVEASFFEVFALVARRATLAAAVLASVLWISTWRGPEGGPLVEHLVEMQMSAQMEQVAADILGLPSDVEG